MEDTVIYARGPRNIGAAVKKASKTAFRKRGFAEHRIVSDWPYIVGEMLARYSAPQKLFFPKQKRSHGTLVVHVYNSGLALELEFLKPVIIEKIATYFGYAAVQQIKIVQEIRAVTPPPPPPPHLHPPTLTTQQQHSLDRLVADIDDSALQERLSSLGKYIFYFNGAE